MSAPIPRYEQGDTRQFTATYSVAPSVPLFNIYAGSGQGSLVFSASMVASSSLAYYSFYTMPGSNDLYAFTIQASLSGGALVQRGLFQVIKTIPG